MNLPRRLRAAAIGILVVLVAAIFLIARLSGFGGGKSAPEPSPAPPTPISPTPSPTPSGTATPAPWPPGVLLRVGTLNWRGASHFHKDPHRGERPYDIRVPHMVAKVQESGITLAGFQEFEGRQARAFLAATHGAWGLVAGTSETGSRDTRDAIAYRKDAWRVDQVRTLSIVYAGNHRVRIPLAKFTAQPGSPARGHSLWVLNTHNPASVRFIGGTVASRTYDVTLEARVLRRLAASSPHTGVLFTGDMNSKIPFRDLFLSLTGKGWKTANPPDRDDLIDWIMGGPGVRFTGTVVDMSTKDRARRYTDHPFVHTGIAALP